MAEAVGSCPYMEWDSLSHLLYLIPEKGQRLNATSTVEIKLTAIDVCADWLVVGSNMAVMYIIDRRHRCIVQRLKCGNVNDDISQVILVRNPKMDAYFLSAGTNSGQLYLYQLALSSFQEKSTPLHTTVVNQSRVTSLQFAPDCKNLYIGDDSGVVTVAAVNPQQTALEPVVLLSESHPIVQLSVCGELLLVSTTAASVVLNLSTKDISKVGVKPRKTKGSYGGCFYTGTETEALIFSVRPGLRLWRCTSSGTVLITHMYKEMIGDVPYIKLQGETIRKDASQISQFGLLRTVDSSTLMSWADNFLVLIDICSEQSTGLLGLCSLPSIVGVACWAGDIFILGGGASRRLHRVSRHPESSVTTATSQFPGQVETSEVAEGPEEGDELPPVVQANDLKELSVSDEHILPADEVVAESEGPAESNLKKIEAKFQFGFGKVKEKLTVSTDDVKQVGQSMKLGFGSLLTKIQNIAPARKPTPIPETEVIIPSGGAVDSVPEDVASATATHSSANVPKSTVPKSTADDTSDEEEEPDFVIRLAPENKCRRRSSIGSTASSSSSHTQRPTGATTTSHNVADNPASQADSLEHSTQPSTELEHSVSAGGESTSTKHNLSTVKPTNGIGASSNGQESTNDFEASSIDHGADCQEFANHFEASQELGNDIETIQELPNDIEASYGSANDAEASLTNAEGSHDTTGDSELVISSEADDSVTGEDLMSRLTSLLDSTRDDNRRPYDLLIQSVTSEQPADLQIIPSPDWESDDVVDKAVAFGRSLSVCEELSDSGSAESEEEYDEEDIYSTKKTLKDPSSRQISKTSESERGGSELSAHLRLSRLLTCERWVCDGAMFSPASMSVTNGYIWVQDTSSQVWVARCTEPGFIWRKLDIKAQCISVAPAGCLAWRVDKGTAYAGHCKAPPYKPWSMKWTKAVEGVTSVSVDDHCAWYIKENGEVWLQSNLSRDRPIKHGSRIACPYSLCKISSRHGNTWGLSKEGRLYHYQASAEADGQQGDWHRVSAADNITDLCLAADGSSCWLIDSDSMLWCMMGLSTGQPITAQQIWQVNYYEGVTVVNRHKFRNHFSLAKAPTTLQLLSVCADLVVVSPWSSAREIYACRTHTTGYHWTPITLAALSSTVKWRWVCSIIDKKVFARYETGEVFYIDTGDNTATSVSLPPTASEQRTISYMTACSLSAWLIMTDNSVYYTTEIRNTDTIRLGLKWRQLNTVLFEGRSVKHISVGQDSAWVVDSSGAVFMSFGINVRRDCPLMSPAWIQIDSIAKSAGFQSVHVNDRNTMVWALDSAGNIFVRKGVTETLPVGLSWVHVVGIKAKSLCISDDLVWAITPDSGGIMCRIGVTELLYEGDSWRQVPSSAISHIAVSPKDDVVGLTSIGQLVSLSTTVIGELKESAKPEQQVDGDWELL